MRILKTRKTFKKEFKRQLRLAITAAIGFTIAYAWRNAIYDSFYDLVSRWSATNGAVLTDFYTGVFITCMGVGLIFVTSKLLRE